VHIGLGKGLCASATRQPLATRSYTVAFTVFSLVLQFNNRNFANLHVQVVDNRVSSDAF